MNDITNHVVGLHVRVNQGLIDVMNCVETYRLSVVQSFLLTETGRYLRFSDHMIDDFIKHKNEWKYKYFIHAAYWSSLTSTASKEFLSLCKESKLAAELHSDGIVVHVGATRAGLTKQEQAQYVADGINELLSRVKNINLILENGPHAGRNFGSDIADFLLLDGMIEEPDRVKYCIDTAHAFVYGYNIGDAYHRQEFFKLMTDVFKPKSIALLHLNDTPSVCGSQIDKHDVAGQGLIGTQALTEFVNFNLLSDAAIILELPSTCSAQDQSEILQVVQSWKIQ